MSDEGAPERRRSPATVWAAVVAVVAIIVIVVGGLLAWRMLAPAPQVAAPAGGGDAATASAQARAVADLIAAWAADDRAAIESHVTSASLPWTAPPPGLPPGISRGLVATLAQPYQSGLSWVVGDPSYAQVTLTADGKSPDGTVTAQIIVGNGTPRAASFGVVLEHGAWKAATMDGLPVAQGLQRLLQ